MSYVLPPTAVVKEPTNETPGDNFPSNTYTAQELSVSQYIMIKKSTIPNAGQGAFAIKDLPANVDLGPYRGVILSEAQYDAMTEAQRSYVVTHELEDGRKIRIDAKSQKRFQSNWTRFINDPYNTNLKPNVILDADVHFVTTCYIKAGCEILWNYGSKYWEDVDILEIKPVKAAARCNCP